MSEPGYVVQPIAGWGRFRVGIGQVFRPESVAAVEEVLRAAQSSGVLARGMGKSYGDASFIEGGKNVVTTRLNKMLHFDEQSGILTCESGTTIDEIIQVFLPRGWFVPVTPGTRSITVGGAFACDVHGKNQQVDGAFSTFVSSIKILIASGAVLTASRQENSDLFFATAGGMGLTGIILEVSIKLLKVGSGFIRGERIKCANLEETIENIDRLGSSYRYSVCWVDCLARGKEFGRSILMLGDHADSDELPQSYRPPAGKVNVTVPFEMPEWLISRYSIGAFNSLKYCIDAKNSKQYLDVDTYFYPLDGIRSWNRLYGRRGFLQYQCVIPKESVAPVMQHFQKNDLTPFLVVFKTMRDEPAPLAFPMNGFTIALDMPPDARTIKSLNELDKMIIDSGGRVYLAKDAILSPENFRLMYPSFDEWLAIRDKYDPERKFVSNLSNRLRFYDTR